VFNDGKSEKKESIYRLNPAFHEAATSEVSTSKSVLMKIKKQQLVLQISLIEDMADLKAIEQLLANLKK